MEYAYVNELVIAGKVVEKNKDHAVVKTVGLNFAGTEEFDHEHKIFMTNDELKSFKKGARIRVLGKFGIDENRHSSMFAVVVEPNYAGDDLNWGKVQGKAHRTFRSLSAKDDKQELGNLLVNVSADPLLVRGALFQPTCNRFNIECTTGSHVTLAGRMQRREFDNRKTGGKDRMLEIVASDDHTNVIETAEIIDPIEQIKAEMSEQAI